METNGKLKLTQLEKNALADSQQGCLKGGIIPCNKLCGCANSSGELVVFEGLREKEEFVLHEHETMK